MFYKIKATSTLLLNAFRFILLVAFKVADTRDAHVRIYATLAKPSVYSLFTLVKSLPVTHVRNYYPHQKQTNDKDSHVRCSTWPLTSSNWTNQIDLASAAGSPRPEKVEFWLVDPSLPELHPGPCTWAGITQPGSDPPSSDGRHVGAATHIGFHAPFGMIGVQVCGF